MICGLIKKVVSQLFCFYSYAELLPCVERCDVREGEQKWYANVRLRGGSLQKDREGKAMEEKFLNSVLVFSGLIVMGIYHVWLLFTILYNPRRTVIGFNAECRQAWVFSMMGVSLSLSLSLSLVIVCVPIYNL